MQTVFYVFPASQTNSLLTVGKAAAGVVQRADISLEHKHVEFLFPTR